MRLAVTVPTNMRRFYPEVAAGGFTRIDGTMQFYTRVNALLRIDMVVLDYGAGRGIQLTDEDESPFRAQLCRLKGKVEKVCGIDIDEAVLANPFLDEARVVAKGHPLPYEKDAFDLVIADWVFEHIENPASFAAEVGRVLKSGGWLCARTPNLWGMIGIGANIIPNSLHPRVVRAFGGRQEADVFPTYYRLNSLRKTRTYFDPARFRHFSYHSNSEPPYVLGSPTLTRVVQTYWRMAPPSLFTDLYIFIQKR